MKHGDQSEGAAIELHIEEMVLNGFEPGDRNLIGAAIERELTRLVSAREPAFVRTNDLEIDRLNLGPTELPQGRRAEAGGTQLAQAIYRVTEQGK